ncbi:MAG: MBL fold metallo-hydrolase [Dehalococcoidia bacterium]|nr:MBL fold metallo-hydrolase [Dehalococcoidia bacterium]
MILLAMPVGRLQANCYVVGDEDSREVLVIDPGDEAERVLREIRDQGLRVVGVLVTHHHLDHSGQAAELLAGAPEARFFMHRLDFPRIAESAPMAAQWYGHAVQPPPEPDRFLEHGDVIVAGRHEFTALHCPGHTPGSLCLYNGEHEGVVFTGDVLFAGSVGRSDFPGGDHAQLIESIRQHLLTLPDTTFVLPGHLGGSTIERERRFNPFLR